MHVTTGAHRQVALSKMVRVGYRNSTPNRPPTLWARIPSLPEGRMTRIARAR